MRGPLAALSVDRISSSVILMAGLSCGALVFFVGLPLARSSPFPIPKDAGWTAQGSSYRMASLVPIPTRASATVTPRPSVEWETMMPRSGILELPAMQASLVAESDKRAGPEHVGSIVRVAPPAKSMAGTIDEVDDYLWQVYERQPVKRDSTGDFSWKDPKAAKRIGKSLKDYVIGGMDRDFREQLYHAGQAMDSAGLRWSMLSAFRDDYRQALASGFKARPGNSLHGGSRAVGGYGHGRAADVISVDGNHAAVWRWLDRNGAKYGLSRPMPGADPAHIQTRGNYHTIAVALRTTRVKTADAANAGGAGKAATKVANAAR